MDIDKSSSPTLHLKWNGEVKQKIVYVEVNGNCTDPIASEDAVEFEFPIASNEVQLNVSTGKKSLIKSNFKIDSDNDYWCEVSGRTKDYLGLKIQISDNQLEIDSAPACYSDTRIGIMAFLFPIYGFVKAFGKYNKKAGLIGALSGFVFSIILTSILTAISGDDTIVIAFRRWEILEYEPFSFIDFAINILMGGLLSLKQIFIIVLEAIFKAIFH